MILVEVTPAHCDVLSLLHKEGFEEQWSAKAFHDLISMPATSGLIALEEEEPMGFILCQGDDVEREIILIATRPECRAKGVGRALLLAELAKTERMFLEVGQDNEGARLFYDKLGFQQVGLRKNYYTRASGAKVDALVLEKANEGLSG